MAARRGSSTARRKATAAAPETILSVYSLWSGGELVRNAARRSARTFFSRLISRDGRASEAGHVVAVVAGADSTVDGLRFGWPSVHARPGRWSVACVVARSSLGAREDDHQRMRKFTGPMHAEPPEPRPGRIPYELASWGPGAGAANPWGRIGNSWQAS